MELRPGVAIGADDLATFAARYGARRLAAFGSVLRPDFTDEGDVDLLVEFEVGRTPGLLTIAAMEIELGALLGREVDLRTFNDLSRYFRDTVAAAAKDLYAA